MLILLLLGHFFILLLKLEGQLPPLAEEARHVLHPVVRVEQSSHRIEKVFVPMQVLLFLDELQLKACPHRFVLQRVVVLDVIYQFLEEVSTVIHLKQSCVLLVGVDARYLLVAVAQATASVILRVKHHVRRRIAILAYSVALRWIEHISRRRLNLLIEFEHLDDIGLLAVALPAKMPRILTRILALLTEQVVLGLVRAIAWCIILSLLLVS